MLKLFLKFSDRRSSLVRGRLHSGWDDRDEILGQDLHLLLPEDGFRWGRGRHPGILADLTFHFFVKLFVFFFNYKQVLFEL
jgi:hypothetical protein